MSEQCELYSGCRMGIYRILVSIYYRKKNFAFVGFVLAVLMMVYFYLPFAMESQPGSHYLNPRVNKLAHSPVLSGQDRDLDISKLRLIKVPSYLTELHKCPACFGKDICEDIDSGAIQMVEPDSNDELKMKGVYNGYWNKQPVVIKRLNKPEEYAKVDDFLCKNVSMGPDCDVSKAILNSQSLALQEKGSHPDFLRGAWKIMHERADQLAVASCLTKDAIKTLSEDFDMRSDNDGELSTEDKAMFFTSLVLNPESLFLQFAKQQGLKIHFPEVLGRCGRIVVTEHAGQPLSTFLKKDFKERADIAMMLLGMIFFLQNFSSKWSLVFSDFNFDNFYVKEDNLYIVDAEDMLVTDTEVYPEPKGSHTEICNFDCFETFSRRLFDYDNVKREEVCPLTPRVTEQAMYALACQRILSYLPEHNKYTPYEGLLHHPPEEISQFLDTALKECVSETTKDGRISAIDIISEMLEKYTDYGDYNNMYNDDKEGDDDHEGKHGDVNPAQDAAPLDKAQDAPAADLAQNAAPVDPAQNAAPVDPAQNAAPVDPEQNAAPVDPAQNAAPVDLAQNAAPVDPAQNAAPVDPARNAAPVDPAKNAAPVDQAQDAAPVDLAKNAAPVDPVQNGVPMDPAQNAAPVDQAQNAAPVDPAQNAAPIDPVQNAAPIDPVQNAAPMDPAQNAAPINVEQNAAPIEAVQNAAPLNPVQNAAPMNQAQNAAPIDLAQNAAPMNQAQNAAPIDPARNAAPMDPAQNAAPMNQAQNAAPMNQAQNAAPIDPAQNAAPMNQAQNAAPMNQAQNAAPMDPVQNIPPVEPNQIKNQGL